jgi:ribosomal protein S18 acetylase RimI-like enzyme
MPHPIFVPMSRQYIISKSTAQDINQLLLLINSAYRGEEAKKGWTHEADLIEGSIRTDETMLLELINKKDSLVLKCTSESGELLGCVYLEKQDQQLYLGMLSVSPQLQGGGIGKELLKAADQHAKDVGCSSIIMNVIPARQLLIAWYNRHGYTDTGKRKPFPTDNRFGTPREPLDFIVLQKDL